jgi:hypothetical protein
MNTTPTSDSFISRWRAFGYALRITRIALVLMIAAWALLLSAQGRDILVNLAERGTFNSQIFSWRCSTGLSASGTGRERC